jgi:hypothetical protein
MRFREQRCYDGDAKGARGGAVATKRRHERDALLLQPSPVLVVAEVMPVCHHAANFDFAVARERHTTRFAFGRLFLLTRQATDGSRTQSLSTRMKRGAAFIVLKPNLRRVARLLLKDAETPLTSGKPF